MENKTIQELVAEIAKNAKGEQEAIEGYFVLLSDIKQHHLPLELYKDIEEIISDEMHHAKKLSEWETKLSNIRPALT